MSKSAAMLLQVWKIHW